MALLVVLPIILQHIQAILHQNPRSKYKYSHYKNVTENVLRCRHAFGLGLYTIKHNGIETIAS